MQPFVFSLIFYSSVVLEFGYSSFKRTFTLPESVNENDIKATYNDGILSVHLPKKEEAKQKPLRTIKIS